MSKVLRIAWREFVATVVTKGFIFAVMITPVLLGLMIVLLPWLMTEEAPKIDGELAVIDPTGEVIEGVRDYLTPQAFADRRGDLREQIVARAPEQLKELAGSAELVSESALDSALGEVPNIRVISLEPTVDLEREKALLLEGSTEGGGRLALVAIHEDAVAKEQGGERFGTYDLYVREKLDDRIEDEIKGGLRQSIVDARVRAAGLDRGQIEELTRVGRVRSTTVTEEGEQETNEVFNILLPAGFMILLLVSVMTGGQYLMSTTIEEKSSRVVEVLLSAVSPMQLMAGKIIGQMCVGFVLMGLYAGMGLSALFSFAMLGLVDLSLFFYLILFYLIAYFVMGSFMAAVGAAVNEPREAQSFMAPIMITMMLPWMLWMPITRDPNSLFATVTSFVPPVNSYVMLLRMTSTTPPPLWQVWVSIAIGVASAYGAVWFAAKVFRVGLLLHGKPPSFSTLVRWVRAA